jgi:DNA-binding NarL/FixJ family response regulator
MKPIPTNERDVVLVVDDSPETLSMLNATLDQAGMTSLVALDGHQALSIARRMLPDMLLLDACMPDMDGFEVCRQLKGDPELKSIPVIFMTGLSDTESVVKGFEVGGIDYVTKPIKSSELIARMRVHLANSRLTLSAQTALDIAGQFVFAVNATGAIQWATPQVHQLLETACGDSDWLEAGLAACIRNGLQQSPLDGSGFILKAPQHNLRVMYLGASTPQEHLLRLLDNNTEKETTSLQSRLQLTAREAEVLLWMARGKTNREIGIILGTSPRTINKHSEKIYKKLDVDNRTAAAAKALQFLEH